MLASLTRYTHTCFTVSVYDGREHLALSRYWAQRYNGPVTPGATVMVLFSMKNTKVRKDVEVPGVKNMSTVYLNVLGVIVLAEPSDNFSLDPSPDPQDVHGVDHLRRVAELDEQVGESGGENEGGEVF